MNPLDLIDRYIDKVGKDPPRKNHLARAAANLSGLEDMLTKRSQKIGKPAWTRQSNLTWAAASCVA